MMPLVLLSPECLGEWRRVIAPLGLAMLGACASGKPIVVTTVPAGASPPPGGARATTATRPGTAWRVDTREHVDLWLHGFALLQNDASLVPYFRLGYAESMSRLRPAAGSQFDANRSRLQRRFAENPNLTSAQFLALYFASWDDLKRGVGRFLDDDGDIRAARNEEEVRMYATVRTYFSTTSDRDWLRLFLNSLDDERTRFYRPYWQQQQQLRASMRRQVESMWSATYRGAFMRFMRNSTQRDGAILLSLPLGGEGRTLAVGQRDNFISVAFPAPGEDAREALFVIAHEIVGTVASAAVRDNSSAADERSGESGKWTTLATVRAGAMLLERVAPDLLDGYQRYYLTLARAARPPGDAGSAFDATFPLPAQIRSALQRQVEQVLSGI